MVDVLPSGHMDKQFNAEAYAFMESVGGKAWCAAHLEDFVHALLEQFSPEEMTQGAIKKAAERYIFARVDSEEFVDIRGRVEAENPAMVGIAIAIMAEHMLELVIARG